MKTPVTWSFLQGVRKKGELSLIHLCFKCVWTLSGIYETNHKRSSDIETPLEWTGSLYYFLWHQIKQQEWGGVGGICLFFFMSVSIKSKLTNIAVSVCKLQVFQDTVVRSMSIKTNRCASTVLQWTHAGQLQNLLYSATQHLVYWLQVQQSKEKYTHR